MKSSNFVTKYAAKCIFIKKIKLQGADICLHPVAYIIAFIRQNSLVNRQNWCILKDVPFNICFAIVVRLLYPVFRNSIAKRHKTITQMNCFYNCI